MTTPSAWRDQKQFVDVLGRRMAYVERGNVEKPAILFLHGNPTSSFLWRDVMPSLEELGRCIAPDLIGMGDSDKLPDPGADSYRFVEHRLYLDAFIDAVISEGPVTLVIHDWGSALGFDWARRNEHRVKAIAYMEGIVRPIAWGEWPEVIQPLFSALRSDAGEQMILEKNVFVEKVLPGSILRTLSEDEMNEYRRPFADPGEARRPTLTWPRQIPFDGEPLDVHAIATAYYDWLRQCETPKLLINADPGAILIGGPLETARLFPNQTELTVKGSHFIQEDSGPEIGEAIARWLRGLH